MTKVIIDPVKAAEKFKADLAAMQIGQRKEGQLVKHRLLEKNFGIATLKFNRWSAELDESQSIEDALDPIFWAGQAEKIMGHDKMNPRGRGDIIEVRKLDTGLFAELLITEIGKGFVKVELLRKTEQQDVQLAEDCPLVPKWIVGRRMYVVVRRADAMVVNNDGFQTKAGAVAWIDDHLKKLAA